MKPLFTSPDRFAEYFNKTVPGAYRQISVQDIRDMTDCGLVKRYGSYGSTDLQTVIGVLQYEQIVQKRRQKAVEQDYEPIRCKLCGKQLPPEPEGKKGRPREYCYDCESKRARDRNARWRKRRRAALRQMAS